MRPPVLSHIRTDRQCLPQTRHTLFVSADACVNPKAMATFVHGKEKAATEAVHTPLALATFKPRSVRLRTRKTGFRPLTSPRATKAALLQNVCPPICWLSCKTRRATPSFAYFTSMPIAWPEPGAEKPLFSSGCDGGAQKEPHPPGYAYRRGRRVKPYRTKSITVTHNSAARLPQPSHDS